MTNDEAWYALATLVQCVTFACGGVRLSVIGACLAFYGVVLGVCGLK